MLEPDTIGPSGMGGCVEGLQTGLRMECIIALGISLFPFCKLC